MGGSLADAEPVGRELGESEIVPLGNVLEHLLGGVVHAFEVDGTTCNKGLYGHLFLSERDEAFVGLSLHGHSEMDAEFVQALLVEGAIDEEGVDEFHLSCASITTCILIGADDEVPSCVFMYFAEVAL